MLLIVFKGICQASIILKSNRYICNQRYRIVILSLNTTAHTLIIVETDIGGVLNSWRCLYKDVYWCKEYQLHHNQVDFCIHINVLYWLLNSYCNSHSLLMPWCCSEKVDINSNYFIRKKPAFYGDINVWKKYVKVSQKNKNLLWIY